MCAMERPHFFTGIVLSAPAILANPETATPFMVNQTLINNSFGSFHSRQRPDNVEEIWKRGFISTVRPTFHTNLELFKCSLNRRNLKTPAFRSRVNGRHFEKGTFWKRLRRDDHVISMTFPEIQIGDCCVLKLLRCRVERNISSVLRMKFLFKNISGVGRGPNSLGDTPLYGL